MDIKIFQEKYNRLPTEFDRAYLLEIEREKVMSKFQILDTPYMHPGKCVNCGGNQPDRKYLDFGLSVEYYGVIYWCTLCSREMYQFLVSKGIIDPPVAETPIDDYKADLEEIKTILNNLEIMVEERLKQDVGSNSDTVTSDEPIADLFVNSETEQTTSKGSTESKSRTSKSNSGARRKDISSVAEYLETGS